MNSTGSPDDALAFARAFIGVQYLLGRRGAELLASLNAPPALRASCEMLVKQLNAPDRSDRARVLAHEISLIAQALQRRELT